MQGAYEASYRKKRKATEVQLVLLKGDSSEIESHPEPFLIPGMGTSSIFRRLCKQN